MKKATIFASALVLVLSLAACGNQDNAGAGSSGGTNSGQTNSGDSLTGDTDANNTTRGWTGSYNSTDSSNGTGSYNSAGSQTGTGSKTGARSTVGNDLRRAADGVGNAVENAVDGGRDMLTRTASTTSFERMLDNARVHDTDGVLTDGENSRR